MHIINNIHGLKIPFQVVLPSGIKLERFVYVYLIFGKKIYLIDSGVKNSHQIIFDYIANAGRKISDIDSLILTHSHPDHIGSAKVLFEQTQCKIFAHQSEKHWIEDITLQAKERPVPGFFDLVAGSVRVGHVLDDSQKVIDLDGLSLKFIPTPGHSMGSLSFQLNESLFVGDAVLLPGQIPIYEDIGLCLQSLKKIRNISGIEVLLSSWDEKREGDEIPILIDNSLNYLRQIHQVICDLKNDYQKDSALNWAAKVLEHIGLPPQMVNSLILKSFESHFKYPNLFK